MELLASNWVRTKAHTLVSLQSFGRVFFFITHRVWSIRASQQSMHTSFVCSTDRFIRYLGRIWARTEKMLALNAKFTLKFALGIELDVDSQEIGTEQRNSHNQWTWGELKRNSKCFLHNSRAKLWLLVMEMAAAHSVCHPFIEHNCHQCGEQAGCGEWQSAEPNTFRLRMEKNEASQ